MTSSEFAREVFSIVEAKIPDRPSPTEFEMAYQSRIAMEQIRFAIRQVEKHMPNQDLACETTLQLADALDRLESADRHFRERFHSTRLLGGRESGEHRNGNSQFRVRNNGA
jgi:hypothetical protein